MLMVVFRRVAGLLFSVANLAEKIGAFGCCFGFRWWRSNGEREVKGCVGHEVFRKQEAAAKFYRINSRSATHCEFHPAHPQTRAFHNHKHSSFLQCHFSPILGFSIVVLLIAIFVKISKYFKRF